MTNTLPLQCLCPKNMNKRISFNFFLHYLPPLSLSHCFCYPRYNPIKIWATHKFCSTVTRTSKILNCSMKLNNINKTLYARGIAECQEALPRILKKVRSPYLCEVSLESFGIERPDVFLQEMEPVSLPVDLVRVDINCRDVFISALKTRVLRDNNKFNMEFPRIPRKVRLEMGPSIKYVTLQRGGGLRKCDSLWQRGWGSKIMKNSVTYFMDGPNSEKVF